MCVMLFTLRAILYVCVMMPLNGTTWASSVWVGGVNTVAHTHRDESSRLMLSLSHNEQAKARATDDAMWHIVTRLDTC